MTDFVVFLLVVAFIYLIGKPIVFRVLIFFCEIWDLFFRNYNNGYPAFSRFEIGTVVNEMYRLNREWNKYNDKANKIADKKYGSDRKGIKIKDYSDDIKTLFKLYLESYSKSKYKEKEMHYMIESNIPVNNGKRTIAEVRKEWNAKYRVTFRQVEKDVAEEYLNWQNQ